MVKRRAVFKNLPESYLFPEINRRKHLFLQGNPDASLISLGIGDTVQPLPACISQAMKEEAESLGTKNGYRGYGNEQGHGLLRGKISSRLYDQKIHPDEIFISDGAKCDIGRLQMLFGPEVKIALQDPAYPVYLEGSVLQGIQKITLMPCHAKNQFFPDLLLMEKHDLIYICHPNNPTGAAYTHDQLKKLVDYATQNHSIILFDVAYAFFIQDASLPRSIYEIPGAENVAIEIGSFSKMAGFSGIRLGWTVVPKKLCFEGGFSVWKDWRRLSMTIYNGASHIAQQGGAIALEEEGWEGIQKVIQIYQNNAKKLKDAFQRKGYTVYGAENAPYLWIHFPGRESWDVFQEFLERKHLIVTPGSGFGPSGEGFIRVSAFGHEEEIDQALCRI